MDTYNQPAGAVAPSSPLLSEGLGSAGSPALRRQRLLTAIAVVLGVLILDQLSKLLIKSTFALHEERPVIGDWFRLHFLENNGMAFGIAWGGVGGKIALTLFRLVAVAGIGYFLLRHIRLGNSTGAVVPSGSTTGMAGTSAFDASAPVDAAISSAEGDGAADPHHPMQPVVAAHLVPPVALRRPATTGAVVALSLILSGALGNIIDSVFYGVAFGYAPLFQGRVVDMLYFPMWQGYYPSWLPFVGGDYGEFFAPVFNIADASISIGILLLLLFQGRFFPSGAAKGEARKAATT